MASEQEKQSVTRRRVFYIPGYDPIHPRRYRELYRKEGAEQAEISGYALSLKAKEKSLTYGWHVVGQMDGGQTHAQVDVLVWSDIVRDSMASNILGTYLQLLRTAWTYIGSGALRRLMWLRKGPVIAALYPVGMLLLQLLVAFLVGMYFTDFVFWCLNAVISGVLFPLSQSLGIADWIDTWRLDSAVTVFGVLLVGSILLRAAIWGAAGVYILRWFKAKDGKFFAYYLMHDYAFSARWGGANPPALETRMSEFGDAIAQALQDDTQEVLVVGHSSGAHLAVSILADLIRQGRVPQAGPALSFLSLGQVVPMMSFLPKADRLRADLHFLSVSEALTWVDVTAPGDGCAFALCDPVAVSGVAPEGKKWPLVFSAAFTQTLSPEKWKALRWRFFRLHFQYLCAFDRPKDYDYFQITAGPMTLGDRYADRPASMSRIDIAVSPHSSMAA